ncbi:MAG: ribulokinase [Lentisphaeria bacterium]|nr:ribulokinase [Lentisphaeria bacterium]
MKDLVIGLDFGSDSVRAILVSATGEELASCVHNYTRWGKGLYSDNSIAQFRQHPLDYLEGMEIVIKGVLKGQDASRVAGIGVDTTGSTPCAVNKDGVPLALLPEFAENPNAMFFLWKDHTAIKEAKEINDLAKKWHTDYTKYEGGVYSPEWFWAKYLFMLRNDPAVREACHAFVEHCDWIPSLLANAPVKPSRCAAGHKAMWHPDWGGLPPEDFLVALDPLLKGKREQYTETYTADEPVGTLCPEWAEKLGLPTDVVIAGGAFDAHLGAVGAGIEPGVLVKVVGTSTCDIMAAPSVDHCIRGICGQVDGSVVPGFTGVEAGQAAFGDAYAWFRRFISYGGEVTLPQLEADAAKLPINQTLTIDWMNGRRTPDANPFLTGALFGLNLGTTAPMVYRSLVESTIFGSRRIADRFMEEGVKVESILAIGGIAKKSKFVMQTFADILKMPIKVAKVEQACALGAAMFAATAAGLHKDTVSAIKAMNSGFDAEYFPNPENAAAYDEKYKLYCAYCDGLEKMTMENL